MPGELDELTVVAVIVHKIEKERMIWLQRAYTKILLASSALSYMNS